MLRVPEHADDSTSGQVVQLRATGRDTGSPALRMQAANLQSMAGTESQSDLSAFSIKRRAPRHPLP